MTVSTVIVQYPVSVLLAPFTMPAVNGSATAYIGSTTWMVPQGQFIAIEGLGSLLVTSIVDGQHAVLQNLGGGLNAAPTTIAPINSTVGVSGAPGPVTIPGPVLGSAQVGINSTVVEGSTDWASVAANATTTILTMPPPAIAFSETVSLSVYVQITSQAGGHVGRFTRLIEVVNVAGAITTPNGGTNDSNLTPDTANSLDPVLAGASAQIVISGSTLLVQVTAPAAVSIFARCSYSVDRGLLPGTGPTPIVTSTSVASGPGAGGTSGVLTGQHFTAATSVTLFGVTATFTVVNDTTINFTSGPFFGIVGPGDIVVTNPNGPGALTNGWTYTSSAATPLTILGGSSVVKFWGTGASLQETSGTVTSWHDASGNANHVPSVGGTTYNASSSNITPPGPTVSCDGGSGHGFILGGSLSGITLGALGGPIFVWMIIKQTSTTSLATLFSYFGSFFDYLNMNGSDPRMSFEGGALTGTHAIVGTMLAISAYSDGNSGAGCNLALSVSNGTPDTATISGVGARSTTGALSIAIRGDANFPNQCEIVEVVVANIKPTTLQLAALETYGQTHYGIP